MRTRQEYMDGKVTHAEYYRQFVTESVKSHVARRIGLDRIKTSHDEHLNDIPLNQWDDISRAIFGNPSIGTRLKKAGDFWSLAVGVCIAKQAARMMLEAEQQKAGSV